MNLNMKSTNRPTTSTRQTEASILNLPPDLQVNVLTYLRAYDLSALQKTCSFYANPELIEKVVSHFADNIYPSEFTKGFDASEGATKGKNAHRKKPPAQLKVEKPRYTFADLRNMELLVVARVLNSPEPATGFFVSKSWCKTALLWLEVQEEQKQELQNQKPKKLSKKKQRLRQRKMSDASPPWSNANIDLLCEHQCLQHCSSGKSARARRRLMDRKAWKILKKLYPDSTQLESNLGECLQCTVEAETVKKNAAVRSEQAKVARKLPLAKEAVRRFYTRRTGVPSQSIKSTAGLGQCPLIHGNYYVVPRSWCYAWRKYIKTGEGGSCPPPDASSLLCDAHRLALIPPHLESYLYGETIELLSPGGGDAVPLPPTEVVSGSPVRERTAAAEPAAAPALIPGQAPDPETLEALRAAGLGNQVSAQLSMFREIEEVNRRRDAEENQPAPPPPASPALVTRNELLDSENYTTVEILTEEEYLALESCWTSADGFGLRFGVDDMGVTFHTTQTCRDCDATGRQHSFHIKNAKNRSRKAIRKSAEKNRAPASLEY